MSFRTHSQSDDAQELIVIIISFMVYIYISGPVGHQPGGSQRGADAERRDSGGGRAASCGTRAVYPIGHPAQAPPSDARIGRCMAGPILASILDAMLPHFTRNTGKMSLAVCHESDGFGWNVHTDVCFFVMGA